MLRKKSAFAAIAAKSGTGTPKTSLDKLNKPVAANVQPHKESNASGLEACLIKNSQGDIVAVNNKIVGQMIQPTIGEFNKGGIAYVEKLVTDKFGTLMVQLTNAQLQEIVSGFVKALQEQKESAIKLPESLFKHFSGPIRNILYSG